MMQDAPNMDAELPQGDLPQEQEQPTDRNREFFRPVTLLLVFALVVATIFSYQYPLQRTWASWGSEHGYNPNGMYIFIMCCVLVFWNRERLREMPKGVNFTGLWFVVAALLWSLAFKRGDINAMQTIGFIGLIWSVCLYLGGWGLAREMMFPLFLSLFAVQWGLGSSTVSLKMRLVSTQLACWMTNVTGAPFGVQVIRQGTNVSLVSMPDLAFDVAAACSGLQSLIMTSVLALLLCHVMLRTWWKRIVLLALIVPVALFNNALRIMLIAYTGSLFGWMWNPTIGCRKMVDFHQFPGLVAYGLGFAMLWFAASRLERMPGVEREMLRRLKEEKEREASEPPAEEDASEPPAEPPVDCSCYAVLWKHVLVVLVLVLVAYGAGVYSKARLYYAKGLPMARNYATLVMSDRYLQQPLSYVTAFPQRIGCRLRVEVPVSDEELKQLPADTAYYRGTFVQTNTYDAYVRAALAVMKSSLTTSDVEKAKALMMSALGTAASIRTNYMDNLALRCVWLAMQARDPRAKGMHELFLRHIMALLVRTDSSPGAITLAVVQQDKDQHSIHTPEACYPAQGWSVDTPVPVPITIGGEAVKAARMDVRFQQQNARECVVYWYQREGMDGRKLDGTSDFFWLPFKTAYNLIFRGRSDKWAFVRVSMSVPDGATYDDAFARLLSFVKEIEPYLVNLE